ncbi:MAG: HAMP domain-containing protein [Deltaproteobacteria bacterium]|nr:MAG: HAMP domain-containing protein [Deltaproteobacteria bacterium]
MQKRIIFLLILNVGIILVSLGVISHLSVNASIDRSIENRRMLANIIGRYIDYVIESNVKRLYDVSLSGKVDLGDNDWDPERKALKTAIEYSIFTGRIFLLDRAGHALLSYPHREEEGVHTFGIPYARKALTEFRPVISDVYTLPSTQRSVVLALVPLKNKDGEVVGVAGGEIDPTNYMLSQTISAIPTGAETIIELVDSHGVIIASNDPRRILTCGDRYRFLEGLVAEKKSAVQSCHRCKEGTAGRKRERDMLAFAPLTMAPWGVIVRDPVDSVFSPSSNLRRGFLLLSAVAIATTLLLAIGLSKGIVRPVQALIGATRKIADGNLDDPIEVEAKDEIGTLGKSVDDMRIKLAESLKSVQAYSEGLEGMVADRTRELHRSREKLAALLQGIITAEEDERKRIARELHDDTSQSLNAALISLDSVVAHFPAYDPIRKQLLQMREQCMAMLKGVHRMIKDLRPPILDDLGLESAIKWVLEKHIGERGIRYRLETTGSAAELKARAAVEVDYPRLELVLFRIAQEGIINISKHAEAENVEVILAFRESAIDMEIRDDGKGFDADSVYGAFRKDHQVGLGLVGMGERISLLDGTLEVRSEPGSGTRISVHVPVPT